MKHFSKHTLYLVRNEIPVKTVITDLLHLPHKFSENYFRFLCPICSEFRTACHQDTNLARCFLCQKNFNNIDLIIISSNLSFVDAVKMLIPHLP